MAQVIHFLSWWLLNWCQFSCFIKKCTIRHSTQHHLKNHPARVPGVQEKTGLPEENWHWNIQEWAEQSVRKAMHHRRQVTLAETLRGSGTLTASPVNGWSEVYDSCQQRSYLPHYLKRWPNPRCQLACNSVTSLPVGTLHSSVACSHSVS